MTRVKTNFVHGVLTADLTATGGTTFVNSGIIVLPTVSSPDVITIVVDPDGAFGAPEIIHITAHTTTSNTATVTRGQEGTTQRLHLASNSVVWRHTATKADWDAVPSAAIDGVTTKNVARDYAVGMAGTGSQSGAINMAISDYSTAGGGIVTIPPGSARCLSTIVMRNNVDVVGSARSSSLSFPTDLGTGVAAIDYAAGHGGQAAGHLRSLIVQGGAYTLGALNYLCDGVRLMAHGDAHDVQVYGFRSGFTLPENHNRLYSCRAEQNYYNVEFPLASNSGGNQQFYGGVFVAPAFASVGVAGGNSMFNVLWEGCHFGFGPYGIHRGDFGGGAGVTVGIVGSVFNNCAFEYIGNSAILDDSTGNADTLTDTDFIRCVYSSSNNALHRLSGPSHAHALTVRNVRNVRLTGSHLPFTIPAGGTSIWRITGVADNVVDHRPGPGWNGTMPLGAGEYISVSAGFTGGGVNGIFVDEGMRRSCARYAIGTIASGDNLGWVAGQPSMVQRLTATTAYAGTAMNAAANGDVVMLCPPGAFVPMLCEAVVANDAIHPKVGTEHHGTSVATDARIVGYASIPGGGGGGVLTNIQSRPQ